MATLRFFCKENILVTVPDAFPYINQPIPRVGRNSDGTPSATPFECEADSPAGRQLIRLMRTEAPLVPADEFTASACGLLFTPKA